MSLMLPSLAFWEEPEKEGETPRLVRADDPAAPIYTGPHCKWCAINLSHPNCINNAWESEHLCPDCGCDPEDVTSHRWTCPRIGTTGNDGPNYADPPWSVDEPSDSKYLREHCSADHLRKIREDNVMTVIFGAMAHCRRVFFPPDAPTGEQIEILGWDMRAKELQDAG